MIQQREETNPLTARPSGHAVGGKEDVGDLSELGKDVAELGLIGLVGEVAEVQTNGVLGTGVTSPVLGGRGGGIAVLRGILRLGVDRGVGGRWGTGFFVAHGCRFGLIICYACAVF